MGPFCISSSNPIAKNLYTLHIYVSYYIYVCIAFIYIYKDTKGEHRRGGGGGTFNIRGTQLNVNPHRSLKEEEKKKGGGEEAYCV